MADTDEKDRDDEELDDDQHDDADDADEDDDAEDDDEGDDADDADEDDDADDDEGDDADADEDDDADADEDEDDDAGDEDDDPDRAASVAKALGVGEDDGEDGEDGEGGEGPVNRAERRRLRAQRRRAGRAGAKKGTAESARDRNKRKRDELLKRRRAAAQAEDEGIPQDRLLASEMIDDALARGTDSLLKWAQRHWRILQWVIVGAVVASVAGLYWVYRSDTTGQAASDALVAGVRAEEGTVIPEKEDQRTDEQKKIDPRVIFTSHEAQQDAALAAYRDVASEHEGTGAAILAKMGEAGVLLDRQQWDEALAAYSVVLDSELAPADMDVKARALEGKGFAQEGKGDLDGALASFEQLGELPSDGFKALSKYHRARVLVLKKDKDKAKELLVEARKDLEKAKLDSLRVSTQSPHRWLEGAVDDELRAIDPDAVPKLPPGGAGGLPPQLQQKLLEKGLTPGMPGMPGGQ